jgi:pyruvate,orthophosphate dikinase
MPWADESRKIGVRANADTGADARVARVNGAEGIGLCRTEHMFLTEERLPVIQSMILSESPDVEEKALKELREAQRNDFGDLLKEMDGLPVTVRLLDPPLHEFLPILSSKNYSATMHSDQMPPQKASVGRSVKCCSSNSPVKF